MILNFKKPMDRRVRPAEWRYKGLAIREAATAFRTALQGDLLDRVTFVPVPPSKARGDPLYDDRLTQMLSAIRPNAAMDIRELIVQTVTTPAAHDSDDRPGPEQIAQSYRIDEGLVIPEPTNIAVVDDILTTGAHFRAVESVLSSRFPDARIVGLFLARRALDTSWLDDFTDLDH